MPTGLAGLTGLTGVAVLLALAVPAVEPAPVAAGAGRPAYVALGDSFAAGLGSGRYFAASGDCYRSHRAYPVRVAASIDARLTFAACAGSKVPEIRQRQLPALRASTRYVSVTAGGNDVGFRRVLTTCAQPRWASDCGAAISRARSLARARLPGRLDRLYAAVARRSPDATVVVAGYPRLFSGVDCNAGTWFGPAEQRRLNRTTGLVDAITARRASAAGFAFADVRAAFAGHAVCDDPEWVNGLSQPVRESYHPNRDGQRAYTRKVRRRLG